MLRVRIQQEIVCCALSAQTLFLNIIIALSLLWPGRTAFTRGAHVKVWRQRQSMKLTVD
jgi:hypothetical protein